MENASYSAVRLEKAKYSNARAGGVMTAVFIVGITICLILGINGPSVYEIKDSQIVTDTLDVIWSGTVSNLETWNQRLFLQMRAQNPDLNLTALTYTQNQTINIWGRDKDFSNECENGCGECNDPTSLKLCDVLVRNMTYLSTIQCKEGEVWCGWTTVLEQPFVDYFIYDMQVYMNHPANFEGDEFTLQFEIVYINKAFTKWEMHWFYAFCLFTLLVMFAPGFGFFTAMIKVPHHLWSRQQVWVATLLVSLLAFNNMFFVFQVHSSNAKFFFDLYVVQLSTFLSILFLFWLEIFADMADGEMQGSDPAQLWQRSRRKALREYAPRLALIFLIWLTTILVYTYVRVKQVGDPSKASVEDLSSFGPVKVFAFVLASVYFIWLLVDLYKTFRHIHRLMSGYRFVLAITLVTIVSTVCGMLSGDLAPSELQPWPIAFFLGLYNMYIFTLAWCYTPVDYQYVGIGDDAREFELKSQTIEG
mmetsp:Transcript_4047/g.6177  ORF Transcript_4047/g.6177 Transcript_4047/m.6177 type:complete len:475 (-) Transcript_4047:57-1481(-)|eukprot:CAMPEP_0171461422 /NCGR_PEP_ID=MMETSP0945-20130129/5878_1 /TAXON_ID=109269 /ORGANISM="Vaucheria litorea, Strain CCMP2940" /LENGTH=474 /DNA_ID=CAMNT_0011987769 /DNA_START=92 /DNA_END=1516 /DNA_ORIENTATION=+